MSKKKALVFLLSLLLLSCSEVNTNVDEELPTQEKELELKDVQPDVNSYTSLFEIPATDIDRAIKFYSTILELEIEKMELPGLQMGILPYENQTISGVIMQAEGYEPSTGGVTIYLNAGNDLQPVLDKIESNGGQVLLPKTAHADNSGYFALFIDSEGNKLGLNSPN